jgi:RNase H-like domain found in reverse transcriptase/Reverse transcriptase (RNA-dependent DNA polymerase)
MFFGLTNSPATFQTMMNTLFSEEIALKWLTIYMDNMAIHTGKKLGETEEQHLQWHRTYVKIVLEHLEKHDLYLKPEKCTFEQSSIKFLGVKVENGTVQMDDEKVDKVQQWLTPTNVTEIRKFLGFTGYYRYFIQNYLTIARPLLELTHKATPWHWTDCQQEAFETLRSKMCTKPILQQPDFSKKFYVQTDASAYGMGAILSQEGGSEEDQEENTTKKPKLHPLTYYSATFTPMERNYDIYERELLAVIKALAHWRHYLVWTKKPFTIQTNHANLLYWKSARKLNGRTARWHGFLQDYKYKIEHVPGKLHTAADALSRPPDANQDKDDNEAMIMIPEAAFIKVADEDSPRSLESHIIQAQNRHQSIMKAWEAQTPLQRYQTIEGPMWKTQNSQKLAIPPDPDLF